MSVEMGRETIGDTPTGTVVIITKGNRADESEPLKAESYQVRQGGHTVLDTPSKRLATSMATALIKGVEAAEASA